MKNLIQLIPILSTYPIWVKLFVCFWILIGAVIVIVLIVYYPSRGEETEYKGERITYSGDGTSQENPVELKGVESSDGGLFAENVWIRKHYPKFWIQCHTVTQYSEDIKNRYAMVDLAGIKIPVYVGDLPPHSNIFDLYQLKNKKGEEKEVWFLTNNILGKPVKDKGLGEFTDRLMRTVVSKYVLKSEDVFRHMTYSSVIQHQFPRNSHRPIPEHKSENEISEEKREVVLSESVENYVDKATGISFPKQIGLLKRTHIRDPEEEYNLSISYSNGDMMLSIFIYDKGTAIVPDGVESAILKKEFSSVINTLSSPSLGGLYKSFLIADGEVIDIDSGSGGLSSFLSARIRASRHEGDVESLFLLRGMGGKFLKVRLTWKADLPEGEKEVKGLLKSLSVVIAPSSN